MYTIGKLHRWVGQVGEMARYNGTECTVLGAPEPFRDIETGVWLMAQETDSTVPDGFPLGKCVVMAVAGDLVPVDPPSGERSVMELFHEPELEDVCTQ